ncbi:MAG: OmpA family protein, partial [SAR324 cluster bacterium]|nr:OmpA family protein [SAR324 cluster bacterium]
MMTFADLITLLFCFFVYLSLFNKPQVDLKTGFLVSDQTIIDLGEHLPNDIVSRLNSMKDLFFGNKELFTEKLETVIGQKPTSLYKTEILIESIAKGTIDENAGVMKVQVRINDPVEDDLEIPIFFAGNARRGPTDSDLCTTEGFSSKNDQNQEFDYMLGSEVAEIKAGDTETFITLCVIDDELFEGDEVITVQIGKLRGDVERGNFVNMSVVIIDNEPLPSVNFEIERRDLYKGISNVTAYLSPISGIKTKIPIKFEGTANHMEDFHFLDGNIIEILPFTEKGTLELEVLQEEVPFYATRTLVLKMVEDAIINGEAGENTTQVNTIIGAQEMKDCSGINRFLRENTNFSTFELNASKSRCILSLPSGFLFQSGGAQIAPKVVTQLSNFLNEIKNRYELEGDAIRVDGHTDDLPLGKKGKYRNNWELSIMRATNV